MRTLGEFVEQEQILGWVAGHVADIHRRAGRGARAAGKLHKLAVSCNTCTAPKTCCSSFVVARLYEGVLIAAELQRTGRDTPELREQLRVTAEAMEAAGSRHWNTPCLFLGARDRCSIYAVRPTTCGNFYVYTPPALCNARSDDVVAYVQSEEIAAAIELENAFREKLALRLKVGRRYLGALPRMVLVALEAWHRSDFRDYLRQLSWPTDEQIAAWGS
ncbi:MAG: YkgJ family cysteine cluster protein [Kofleriaceae bacterium]